MFPAAPLSLLRAIAVRAPSSFSCPTMWRNPAHLAKIAAGFDPGSPPLLFHKADVGAGPELEEAVRRAITDRGQQVVGAVHNAVDAQLGGSDQLELVWSAVSPDKCPACCCSPGARCGWWVSPVITDTFSSTAPPRRPQLAETGGAVPARFGMAK